MRDLAGHDPYGREIRRIERQTITGNIGFAVAFALLAVALLFAFGVL